MSKTLIVTGSSGLIGSEVVSYFSDRGFKVVGIDNNQREYFFGPSGSTVWNRDRLKKSYPNFVAIDVDIRDYQKIEAVVSSSKPYAVVHAAAQPSHDRASAIPFDDFTTNANGTLNLLEAVRHHCPSAPFIYLSTNKVYGDRPNSMELTEGETRWEFANLADRSGISENCSVDQSMHSLFGVSKLSADLMVQEYGRYFGLRTCCLRGGCLTGANHSGVELHGFLSYLVRCNIKQEKYIVHGYKGKQVRDNIDAFDVATFIEQFITFPRVAEVYNIGGGLENSISLIEAFNKIEALSGKKMIWEYSSSARKGDHIVYYSDLTKIKGHYPDWEKTKNLDVIFEEIHKSWLKRLTS